MPESTITPKGGLSYWAKQEQIYGRSFPDMGFWALLRVLYPNGLGEQKGYEPYTLRDLYSRYKTGALNMPSTPTVGTGTPDAADTAADADKKYGGYTIQEWTLGIPQFQAQQGDTEWEKEKTRLAGQQAQAEWNTTRLASIMGGGNNENAINQALADQYDTMRDQLAAQLQSSPRDWVNQYKIVNAPNPYRPKTLTPDEQLAQNDKELKQAQFAFNVARDLEMQAAADPNRALSGQERDMVQAAKDNLATMRAKVLQNQSQRDTGASWAQQGMQAVQLPTGASEQEMAGFWATPQTDAFGRTTVGAPDDGMLSKPKTPEIPSWLQGVSGLQGRVPTTRTAIQRPSMQTWANLAPGQQGMYEGLVNAAGKDTYADTLAQMQRELTNAPTLGKRWASARQWA